MDIQKYKKLKIKVFFLTLIIIGLVGYIAYDKVLYKYFPQKEEKTEEKEIDSSMNMELDEIVVLVKDYFYSKDLVEENNLVSWSITSSEYLGYIGDNNDTKYYQLQGSYSCKDQSPSCVHMNVEDKTTKKETNFFQTYAIIDESGDTKKVKSVEDTLTTEENFNQINKEVPKSTKREEEIKKVFKTYYEAKGFIQSDNLTFWEIKSVNYVKTKDDNKVYQLTGTYSCNDNTESCLHFDSPREPVDSVYPFDLLVTFNEKNGIYSVISIEQNIYQDKSVTIKREDLISMLKTYTKDSNLMTEENLIKWDISSVVYLGYYNTNTSKKYYSLKGTYSCKDNSATCIKLDNYGVKRNDGSYAYSIYMEVTYNESGGKVTALLENLPTNTDFVSSNQTIN